MLALSRHQSRTVDSVAIHQYGIPGMVLMENAGRGVAESLLAWDASLNGENPGVISILCGKGNNAGDGFVIARHLEIHGARPHVVLLCNPAELRGDALQNYQILEHTNVRVIDLSGAESSPTDSDSPIPRGRLELADQLNDKCKGSAWIVDAMLGTGAQGEPREPFCTAIDWMNRQTGKRLAVDVPSGLDCDTGQPAGVCVQADHTCTFVAAKQGFSDLAAEPFLGKLHVISIGIPPRLIMEVLSDA